jgi:hypothetical protein
VSIVNEEPVGLVAAVNGAVTATFGILTLTEVLDPKVAGGIITALTAWIGVLAIWTRSKVTPFPGENSDAKKT